MLIFEIFSWNTIPHERRRRRPFGSCISSHSQPAHRLAGWVAGPTSPFILLRGFTLSRFQMNIVLGSYQLAKYSWFWYFDISIHSSPMVSGYCTQPVLQWTQNNAISNIYFGRENISRGEKEQHGEGGRGEFLRGGNGMKRGKENIQITFWARNQQHWQEGSRPTCRLLSF